MEHFSFFLSPPLCPLLPRVALTASHSVVLFYFSFHPVFQPSARRFPVWPLGPSRMRRVLVPYPRSSRSWPCAQLSPVPSQGSLSKLRHLFQMLISRVRGYGLRELRKGWGIVHFPNSPKSNICPRVHASKGQGIVSTLSVSRILTKLNYQYMISKAELRSEQILSQSLASVR